MSKERSVGYISGNRDKGTVLIMIAEAGEKSYFHADLVETLEALTGRKNFAVVRAWKK
jgi:hypothetical protein